jgi:uncharacterized protein with PQ loop repeat
MEFTVAMSWIGFVTGILIGIPQIVKTIRMKSARDVSSITFLLLLITCSCLLIRAIAIKEAAFICYYSFIILSASFQLFLIWKYKASDKGRV